MNFSNTFARLKEIIDEIFNKEFQIKYPNLYELTINNNRYTLLLRFLFGIEFFEMDAILARKYFRSNRYFMDSLVIDLLPEIKEVVDFENNIEINGESIRIIIKNILNKIKDEKCSELNLLTDYQKNLLNDNGYIVINNLIPHDVCDALNEKALWIAKNELENNCAYIYGSGNMQRVYNLIAKDNLFYEPIAGMDDAGKTIPPELYFQKIFETTDFNTFKFPRGRDVQFTYADFDKYLSTNNVNLVPASDYVKIRSLSDERLIQYKKKDIQTIAVLSTLYKKYKNKFIAKSNSDMDKSCPAREMENYIGEEFNSSGGSKNVVAKKIAEKLKRTDT